MASKLQLVFLLFLSIFACIQKTQGAFPVRDNDYVDKVKASLTSAGFVFMGLTLEIDLPVLMDSAFNNNNKTPTAITIFSPTEQSFNLMGSIFGFILPPEEIVQYHVALGKVEKEDFNQSSLLPVGTQIDTLFQGHHLVVTTSSLTAKPSINAVEINQWDIFNDGRVIIHGVETFFDPAFPMSNKKAPVDTNTTNTNTSSGNNSSISSKGPSVDTNNNTTTTTSRGSSNNSSSRGSSKVHYGLVVLLLALTMASTIV